MHEAGETARSFLDRFKDQPLVLALVAMNLGLLGILYWTQVEASNARNKEMELLYENRKQVGELLFKCVPPSTKSE